jgi:hypothetical protein
MLRLILSNRWLAAIWAMMTLISISAFVREDSPSMKALDEAANKLRAQRHQEAALKQASQNAVADNYAHDADALSEAEPQPSPEQEPAFGEGIDPNPQN